MIECGNCGSMKHSTRECLYIDVSTPQIDAVETDEWLREYTIRYGDDGRPHEPWTTDAAQVRKDFLYRKGMPEIPGTDQLQVLSRRVHYIVEPSEVVDMAKLDAETARQQTATDPRNYRW